jgi:arylsulfatase
VLPNSTATTARALVAAWILVALPGCAPDRRPPNVLVISIDTLRQDHVSAYGYARATTPNIDALAREGALFRDAVSSSNWTLPAHMSLMTGLAPSAHRVEDDGHRLPASVQTLAGVLAQAGWRTGGFTSHVYLDPEFGFARGFDDYETVPDQRADAVTDKALAWLERPSERPFFLFLHYFDPHWEYDPPEPFASRFGAAERRYGSAAFLYPHLDPANPLPAPAIPEVVKLYDGEIAFTDHHIGRLVDRLRERGQLDDTLVVVVSDHGEEFGEHGTFGHGTHLHGEVTRVPLIVRAPGRAEAGERRGTALLSDLPHTLLAAAGVRVPEQFAVDGVDLLAERDDAERRIGILESTRWGPRRFAARTAGAALTSEARWRPVAFRIEDGQPVALPAAARSSPPMFFDLTTDPAEALDLMAGGGLPPGMAELDAALRAYARDSVHALRVTIGSSRHAGRTKARIAFDGVLVDEPWTVLAQRQFTLLGGDERSVELELDAGSIAATFFFAVDAGADAVTVTLTPGDAPQRGFEATLELLPPGAEHAVPFADPDAPRVTVERVAPAFSVEQVLGELSDEDRATLRALGYVE